MNEDKKAIELKHRLYYADYVDKNFIEKDKIREIMRKDRNCLTFGYHSAYVGLLDDLIKLIEEE